jgi:hypothetical protein
VATHANFNTVNVPVILTYKLYMWFEATYLTPFHDATLLLWQLFVSLGRQKVRIRDNYRCPIAH